MNLVTELENELVFALLVERKNVAQVNPGNALDLINKIKSVLRSNSVARREKKANSVDGKTESFFSH